MIFFLLSKVFVKKQNKQSRIGLAKNRFIFPNSHKTDYTDKKIYEFSSKKCAIM